jgi:uncharacterized protein involved in cysteine biosynthesis
MSDGRRRNWKLIVLIHQVALALVLFALLLVPQDMKRVLWIVFGGLLLSLLVQVFVFNVRSRSFRNRTEQHPDELIDKK